MGVTVELQEEYSSYAAGVVMNQNVEANASIYRGDKVILTVSKGVDRYLDENQELELPDFVGMTMEEATDSLELIEQIYEAPVVMQDVKTIAVVRDRTDGVRTVEFRYKDWYINVYGPAETVNQELIMRFSLAYYAQKPQQPISISSTVSSAS